MVFVQLIKKGFVLLEIIVEGRLFAFLGRMAYEPL